MVVVAIVPVRIVCGGGLLETGGGVHDAAVVVLEAVLAITMAIGCRSGDAMTIVVAAAEMRLHEMRLQICGDRCVELAGVE